MKEVNVCLMSICKLALIRAVFDWSVVIQNQTYHSSQSQRTQAIQWTNQNSKQIGVAGTKCGETCASKLGHHWFWFYF